MPFVLAHQGGWDEIGIFVIVAIAAIAALRWAERRVGSRNVEDEPDKDQPPEETGQPRD